MLQLKTLKHSSGQRVAFRIHPECGHSYLQNLNLNGCEVDKVPEAVAWLHSLKVLQLANNGLMDIPADLTRLNNLECLNLEGNCFPQLPEVPLPSLCFCMSDSSLQSPAFV